MNVLGTAIGLDDGAKTAITEGMQAVTTDTTGLMWDLLPYALGVMAAKWGVGKAIGFFKSTAR